MTSSQVAAALGLRDPFHRHLVFLTLFPDSPQDPAFAPVTYESLLAGPAPLGGGDRLADDLIEALWDLLGTFYRHGELYPEDLLLGKLRTTDDAALDGGYLGFNVFLDRLRLPDGVHIDARFRTSQQGRMYYGAVIARKSWKSAPIEKHAPGWSLPPGHFHVHLEPQFNALSVGFQLYVHYETNPYHPVKELQARVPVDQYESYLHRRNAFAQRFAMLAGGEFKIGGGSNQIAKVPLSLTGRTVEECVDLVSGHLGRAATLIDDAVRTEFGIDERGLSVATPAL